MTQGQRSNKEKDLRRSDDSRPVERKQTERDERTALIIGCGVAGPVLAMYLQRAGFTPKVYEASDGPRDDEGAFLELAPMGVNILKTLDITDEDIRAAGGFSDSGIIFYNSAGKRIGELDGSDEEQRYGARSYVIKRGRLAGLLREHAGERGISISFGKKLVEIELGGDESVQAVFDDGTVTHGEFLVGCDGIHSMTRRLTFPDAPQPEYTGLIDCGGFTTRPTSVSPSGDMHMTFGKRAFFGHLAKPDDEVYWFDNLPWPSEPQRDEIDSISSEEWKQRLLGVHSDDWGGISEIIASTDGEIGKWPLYDLPELERWYKGPVCLVGDAAHATPPHNGHGASMALEDAIVLAKCLRDIPVLKRAFQTYQNQRADRVDKVASQARRIGKQKAISNPVKLWFRDLLMPVFIKFGTNSMDWLFAYQVEWDPRIG